MLPLICETNEKINIPYALYESIDLNNIINPDESINKIINQEKPVNSDKIKNKNPSEYKI